MIEIILAVALGIIAGTFTGIIPGLHINLVALLLLINASFFLEFTTALVLASFVVSMSITHTFLDFLPSIFLGAPEESTALSVLPGHRMLMKGRGYEAIKITTTGAYLALLLVLLVTPIFLLTLPWLYPLLKFSIPFILIAASTFLILKEKQKFLAFFLFSLSGVLGIATLNLARLEQPLLPLLTGLFGTSMLFMSITKKVSLPRQKITEPRIEKKEKYRALGASIVSGSLCSFLPGLGAAQAAVLGSEIAGKLSQKGFLLLLGAIGTLVSGLNFIAIYAIGRPRSGTAVVVSKLLEEFTLSSLFLLLLVALISGSIAFFITLWAGKKFATHITKINYSHLSLAVLFFLLVMNLLISGILALPVLLTASAIGILAIIFGIRKMHLMGCLILPVVLYYLF